MFTPPKPLTPLSLIPSPPPSTLLSPTHTGAFSSVSDSQDLRTAMASYYESDAFKPDATKPLFTVPYFDASGLGLVTTAAVQVLSSTTGKPLGVAGVDLSMDDLMADVNYLNLGDFSYGFLIDGKGRAMSHPLLPNPAEYEKAPVFVDISQLEPASEFTAVRASMLARATGSKAMTMTRSFSRGSGDTSSGGTFPRSAGGDGVDFVSKPATYYWAPINGTEFSVCLVIADVDVGATELTTAATAPRDGGKLASYYHRIDLANPLGATMCNMFGTIATMDTSTIKFGPEMFTDPYDGDSLYIQCSEIFTHRYKKLHTET